jgi:acetolactate synthase-1/2/3 large subunit
MGAPDRPVITISGDGGFLFGATELATAVQYSLNTVNIVFNDNAYGNPNREQHEDWGGRAIGTELTNPDFVAFGRSFGIDSVRVSEPESLAAAIKDALAHDGPSLIEYPHERLPYVFRDPPKTAGAQVRDGS